VFWRETGMKDDDDDVDAREGACSIETAMLESLGPRAADQSAGRVSSRRFIWQRQGLATLSLWARRCRAEASVQRDCGLRNCAWAGAVVSRRRRCCGAGGVAPQRRQSAGGQAMRGERPVAGAWRAGKGRQAQCAGG
jgi:hypothetical protein